MANGRFLDKRTAKDERLGTVSLKAHFLYLALTPFADVGAKLSGNVTLVKADTCPLRREMTERVIKKCLQELHDVGLIEWYKAGSKKVLRMCDFSRYQQGLRRDRENQSEFPDPEGGNDPAECRQSAGVIRQNDDTDPAQVQEEVQVQDEVQEEAEVELQDQAEAEAQAEASDQVEEQEKVETGETDDCEKLFGPGPSLEGSGPLDETIETIETVVSSPGLSWADHMRERVKNL